MYTRPFHILMILSLLVVSSAPQWGYASGNKAEQPVSYAISAATSGTGDMQDPLPLPPVEEQVVEVLLISDLPATHALPSLGYTSNCGASGWHVSYTSFLTSRVIVPPPEVINILSITG